ncbi:MULTISPECIES: ribonuclease HI family protein [Moorena]|uniref:Riibonuclease HI n=1 Tax=Moorena producens 3L TaxID=489825 RepID=F4XJ08_9CYAN|nr:MULTISPECIES: ribonuclease HI family protein [Moorena]NEQ16457.1 ribonuclease HI family protein [Moorena sp. SIO3E2]EGJ35465.1 riibonuclease HI [Moorena producens 3L]NEP35279.1 ribonuclease HI family protein [Moorena sp. SIO3B2]NEP69802.1 ribonuclease HI family protein [Moorena sp. SIO3A5]NER89506.1 ribonuclease HI family protein [Moorena sp. SIO3A2]
MNNQSVNLTAKKTNSKLTILFDGGSRGNPGIAGAAAIIKQPGAQTISVSKFFPHATNNEAEYNGAILGLEKALEIGAGQVVLKGDSQLVINQLKGTWRVKTPHLRPLWTKAKSLLNQFDSVKLEWIPRAQNSEADAAANQAMDQRKGVSAVRNKATGLPKVQPSLPKLADQFSELPKVQPVPKLANQISELIADAKNAKFKNLLKLKSGRDEFTSKRLPTLKEMVPASVQNAIASAMADADDSTLAKVYRWYLRGLPADLAIRKVQVDLEVSEKIIERRKKNQQTL